MELKMTPSAVSYTVAHIMKIAAPALPYTMEITKDGTIQIRCTVDEPLTICLSKMSPKLYPQLLDGTYPVSMLDSYDGRIQIAAFLPPQETDFLRQTAGEIMVYGDIVTISFLLLSRKEEQLTSERDIYGRFPYDASLAKKYGFVSYPIIDEWAMLLRKALLQQLPAQVLGPHQAALRPTHDMDNLRRFPNLKTALRSILGGDLLIRKDIRLAWKSLGEYRLSRKDPMKDPSILGGEKLLTLSQECGLCSEFYFMGLEPGEEDCRYDIRIPSAAAFGRQVEAASMICGFHPSRLAICDEVRFSVELQRVEHGLGQTVACGRQHYLGFDAEHTPLLWEHAGLHADSTLGFAEQEGFRCGTCHAFPLYDLRTDCPLRVIERPLIAMDVSMRSRGLTEYQALASLQALFSRTLAVGGEFVILWHNDNAVRDWSSWFDHVYTPFIRWAAAQVVKGENP